MSTELERFSDTLDQAQAINEQHQEASLALFRERSKPEQVRNEDGSWPHPECVDCGIDIPEARLNLGKVRCVDCQELLERRSKGLFRL